MLKLFTQPLPTLNPCLAVAAAVCFAVPSQATAEVDLPSFEDRLTTEGRAAWSISNLGPQVTLTTVLSTAVDAGNTTRPAQAYFALMGEPGKLAVVDFATAKLVRTLDVPGSNGSYGLRFASDGNLYLASHSSGFLYRYTPGAEKVEKLGKPADHVSFIWDVVEGNPGKLYGGCYPESTVFEFDITTGKFRDLGPAKPGEDYARSVAWDQTTQRLYVGVGSHADVIEVDPASGQKRSILPEPYRNNTFVYSIGAAGGHVIARVEPGNKAVIIDPATATEVASLPTMTGSVVSPPGADGAVYFSGAGKLHRYHPATKTGSDTGYVIKGEARGFSWSADGQTLLIATTAKGVQEYDPQTHSGKRRSCELPALPLHIHNLTIGPDGKVYSSGYVAGHLGVYDPASDTRVQVGNAKQAEGMTWYKDLLYLGTYPGANLTIFNSSKPAGPKNPRTLWSLEDQGQDRPFGMLAVPEKEKVFMGTVPGYGLLGGALAIVNPTTSEPEVHRNLIQDQSIVTLAYRDGILYGGTTIHGGLGVEPTQKDGKLFLWDVKKGELITQLVPVPGKRGLSSLQWGPDNQLWGWAEGALFAFDPGKREVLWHEDKIFPKTIPRHYWRGGYVSELVDGKFYGCSYGTVWVLDTATRQMQTIAEGGFELLKRDAHGNLYVVQKDNLVRLERR